MIWLLRRYRQEIYMRWVFLGVFGWGAAQVIENKMAERVGFEPTLEFPLNTLSKRAPSTTRPSLLRKFSGFPLLF